MSSAATADVRALAPPAGHAVGTPAPIISAISDETIAALRERYGGNQQERDAKAAAAATTAPAGKGAGGKAPGGPVAGKPKAPAGDAAAAGKPKPAGEAKPPKDGTGSAAAAST